MHRSAARHDVVIVAVLILRASARSVHRTAAVQSMRVVKPEGMAQFMVDDLEL